MSEHLLSHPMNPNQAIADSLGEQLSALMDGELARDQVRFLLRGVEAQSDLAQRWSSYHLISASLRREYVAVALPADFAASVLGRLDAGVAAGASRVSRRIGFGALRWVGGSAIAAAVAVVALTVSRPVDRAGTPEVAALASTPASRQPYLPIALPLPNTMPSYNAVQPASFEHVVPDYSLPNGTMRAPAGAESYRVPYLLLRLPGPMRDGSQSDTVPTQP